MILIFFLNEKNLFIYQTKNHYFFIVLSKSFHLNLSKNILSLNFIIFLPSFISDSDHPHFLSFFLKNIISISSLLLLFLFMK